MYYLQSRYYDSNVGRFVNADDAAMISNGVINLFNYCNNNCVIGIDTNGHAPKVVVYIVIAAGVAFTKNYIYSFNCYAYAMGEYGKWLVPSSKRKSVNSAVSNMPKNKYSCNDMANWIISDFGKKVVRKLKNSKDKLKKGEYRIAFRTENFYYQGVLRHTIGFHFWKQDPSTKKWWEKGGHSPMKCIGKVNADNSKYWSKYDSKTAYMAVKRKFTKW